MSSTSTSTAGAASRNSSSARQPSAGMMLVVVVLGTWIGIAGAAGVFYYLARSGRIAFAGAESERAKGNERSIALEPVLANLADPDGHAFVRLGLRVELADDGGAEGGDHDGAHDGAAAGTSSEGAGGGSGEGKSGQAGAAGELESSIRDTILAVLGRQTSAELLGPDGKEHLKIELREAIERGGVRVKVKDLFFTDFVVQS